MINLYSYLFYSIYNCTRPIIKYEDKASFSIISFMLLLIMVYFGFMSYAIWSLDNYTIDLIINSKILSLGIVGGFYGLNYLIFQKNNRYIAIMEKIKSESKQKKRSLQLYCYSYY